MATESTTWLSLGRIKQELRLPNTATDQDVMLTGHLDSAVKYIESKTGIPLLERNEIRPVRGASGHVPMEIGFVSFLQSVPRIDYWDQARMYESPDGKIEEAFETRAVFGTDPNSWRKPYLLLPPATGFPVSRTGEYHVTIQSGMNPTAFPNITQILIALVREFYLGGNPEGHSNSKIERMIEPLYEYCISDHGAYYQ